MSSDTIMISTYRIWSMPLKPRSTLAKFSILGLQQNPTEINRIFQNSFEFSQVLTGSDRFHVDSHWELSLNKLTYCHKFIRKYL